MHGHSATLPGTTAMAERRYLLLLNDALKAHIVLQPEARQRRLREKLEFLENGLWDAGIRVKKLRGTAKVVFEARLSRGERLLFTLGRHREAVAVYVWGLVQHDDVSAEAKRIVPSNAPFLDFEELEHEDRQELNLDSVPAPYLTQENVEEQVPEDYGPQRWLVFDEEEWGRLLASPDPASFEGHLHLTREQEEVLASPPPVLLSGTAGSGKTTLSVYYLLRGARAGDRRLFLTCNPLLKRFAERIHAGLAARRVTSADGRFPRFALFREIALEIAGGPNAGFPPEAEVGLREFTAILYDHRDRGRLDPELAWEEIRSIIKGATVPLDPKRCAVLVERFTGGSASAGERRELLDYLAELRNFGIGRKAEAGIVRRSLFRDWDDLLVTVARPAGDRAAGGRAGADRPANRDAALGMIVELVGKQPSDFSRPLLALDDYLALGRKRAPNFRYDRAALHAVAEFYQERLERSGRWDEIDLARAALRNLTDAAGAAGAPASSVAATPWDLVVCDEVQDLADVQIALLFRLAADPRSVVLTGDPRQILNPTSFRWEEVKYRFRERGLPVPEVKRLSLNFRCVGPIVRLANALLDLKASLIGLSDTEMREDWKFGGRPPVVLEGASEEALLGLLAKSGAGQVILTRTAAEAARLRSALGTELVFTIAEAKGLEFDTVLLWKFAADEGAEAIWRAIAAGARPEEDRLPHVRYELALLYVAVTRTRSTLLAWDGERPAPVWDAPGIGPLVHRTREMDRLAALWKTVSSPAEWEEQGDYFFERENHSAARECYRNAGAEGKQELAAACVLERDGDHGAAAVLFERRGEHARAAACWERTGDWESAETAWRSCGDGRRALACSAHASEARGELGAAALAWESLGDGKRAASLWQRAGAFDRLARSALAEGEFSRAAEHFEKARMGREAAAAWERAGESERAGDLWLRLGNHAEAARLFRRSHSDEKLLRCLRQLGEHRQAALILEKRGEIEKAVEAFAAAAAVSEEAKRRIEAEIPEARTRRSAIKAAIRLAALGRDAEAAPLFIQGGIVDAAARRYQKTGDHYGLSRCHEAAGRWREAARELGLAADPGENAGRSAAIQSLLFRHLQTARAQGREKKEIESLVEEAETLRAKGNLAAALARYRLFGNAEAVAELSRKLGWHEDAIDWLLDTRNTTLALRYAREGGFAVPLSLFDSLRGRHLGGDAREVRGLAELRETFVHLLRAAVAALGPEEACTRVEEFFADEYGMYVMLDRIPEAGLNLLVEARAATSIMRLLAFELGLARSTDRRLKDFLDRLQRAAAESGDDRLAACSAYAAGYRQGVNDAFEKAAERLPLAAATAAILGRSRRRYKEAVAFLIGQGEIEEAEMFCRINDDPGLAAGYAESRGDFKGAVRHYREARDLEGSLRSARKSADERQVARVLEWRGEYREALEIWRKLGRAGDVARVLKKRPLLKE